MLSIVYYYLLIECTNGEWSQKEIEKIKIELDEVDSTEKCLSDISFNASSQTVLLELNLEGYIYLSNYKFKYLRIVREKVVYYLSSGYQYKR